MRYWLSIGPANPVLLCTHSYTRYSNYVYNVLQKWINIYVQEVFSYIYYEGLFKYPMITWHGGGSSPNEQRWSQSCFISQFLEGFKFKELFSPNTQSSWTLLLFWQILLYKMHIFFQKSTDFFQSIIISLKIIVEQKGRCH